VKEGEVASKNRGGRSVNEPGDEPADEIQDAVEDVEDLDDEADDDADEADDEFDEDESDDEDDDEADDDESDDDEDEDDEDVDGEPTAKSRRRDKATRPARATGSTGPGRGRSSSRSKEASSPGILGRFVNFVREVVAELQKVIWPTRKELLTYTSVVVVFVAIMMTFVALLDYGFARGMFLVFGSKTTSN